MSIKQIKKNFGPNQGEEGRGSTNFGQNPQILLFFMVSPSEITEENSRTKDLPPSYEDLFGENKKLNLQYETTGSHVAENTLNTH